MVKFYQILVVKMAEKEVKEDQKGNAEKKENQEKTKNLENVNEKKKVNRERKKKRIEMMRSFQANKSKRSYLSVLFRHLTKVMMKG